MLTSFRFEKQFGDREGVEDVILSKRRVQYEEAIKENPKNYDNWIDLARLEETAGDMDRVRDAYERAIAQIPPTQEKRHWRRYIYLWIFYALWEEMDAKDIDRARQIYNECLKLIPHKKFTFSKVWLLKAQFEVRHMNLSAARKTLGQAIGMSPKDKLFKGYIELELKLFEFNRCRTLYEKHIEWNPSNSQAWIKFSELERGLDDLDRARAIFELAVQQETLDMPELVWKSYIDFEEEEGEYDRTRTLYERLLAKTDHVKVWISYAHFEINVPDDEADEDDEERPISDEAKRRARSVFERAYKSMKEKDLKEEVSLNPSSIRNANQLTRMGNSVSRSSTRGSHSSRLMARQRTWTRSSSRCPSASRRGGGSTRPMAAWSSRSTWTTSSRPTRRARPSCRSCCRRRPSGRRRRQRRRARMVVEGCVGGGGGYVG